MATPAQTQRRCKPILCFDGRSPARLWRITKSKPAITDNGGLFLRPNIQADQPRKHKINKTPPKFQKLGLFDPFPIPTHTQSMKHAYSAILAYLRHIYPKGRQWNK